MAKLPTGSSREFTRRSVLAIGGGIGAAIALPAGFARAQSPTRGGVLRVGSAHGASTDSLDPATYSNGFQTFLALGGIHNYITAIDERNELAPELAEEWSSNDDASEWTFKVRPGVTFHNGKTVTAADMAASIDHHRGPDSKSGAAGILKQVTEIKADGDRLVVTLEGPNADFAYLMSEAQIPVLPSVDGKVDVSGVGAGGYVLQEFEPGVRARLARNENYWKTDRAWFDAVEMLVIADPTARQAALMSGRVDLIDRVDPKTAKLLGGRDGIVMNSKPSGTHYALPMRVEAAPFGDVNVRLALKHALNREEVLEKILGGYGMVGNDQPISPVNRYHADDLEPLSYDPDKARHYLKQAGQESLSLSLSVSDAAFVGAVDMATLYREHAAPAGIDIKVVREPADGYWSDVWTKKPWCASYWTGRPVEDQLFSTIYAGDAPWNDTGWSNERFDKLMLEGRRTLDDALRREIYREMQQIVRDDAATIIPMFANSMDAYTDKLAHGHDVAGNREMDGNRAMERWWFA